MNSIFDNKVIRNVFVSLGVVLAVFLLAQTIAVLKSTRYAGVAPMNNAITVTGQGEISVVPDIATVSFSVEKTAKTTVEANTQMTAEVEKILGALDEFSIASKDIQTTNYSIYPKYEYTQAVCSANYCPPSRSTLVGYTVSESVTIKIRNLDAAGQVLTALASNGATNVSGLNFGVDDEKQAQNDARAKAIEQAQEKAQTLAKQLGVKLVGVVDFSESNGGVYPLYAKTMSAGLALDARAEAAPVPVQVGENTVVSNVSITYQIR